jgi:hypothetical protein
MICCDTIETIGVTASTHDGWGAGPLRVVVDSVSEAIYYTWTHYGQAGDPAFVRIR